MPPVRNTRATVTLVVALSVAAVCVRFGVWQMSRLSQRQAHNAILAIRLADSTIPVRTLPADTADGHYRRVGAAGVLRYDRELTWAPRMRQGSPGVNFLTPLELTGSDTVVLVDRGWAYSPDAKTVDRSRWRERDTVAVRGYAETWGQDCQPVAGTPLSGRCGDSTVRVLRRLDRRAAERLVGRPIAPYLIMQTSDSALRADSVPVRAEEPLLDEGPHRGYAFQWFGFATIAVVGGIALALGGRRR